MNKKEFINEILSKQTFAGPTKYFDKDEAALMDSFLTEKLSNEFSFIDELGLNEDEKLEALIKNMNKVEIEDE